MHLGRDMRHGGRAAQKTADQPGPFLRLTGAIDAGRMGFIHDHEIWACPREAFTTLFGLDVVEAHHRVGVGIEQRLGQREAAFQPRGTA